MCCSLMSTVWMCICLLLDAHKIASVDLIKNGNELNINFYGVALNVTLGPTINDMHQSLSHSLV